MNQKFITEEIINELGINLNGQDIDSLLTHLNDTLAERVGTEITETLDDEQLKVLLELEENADEEKVGEWLEQNVPDLKQITQDEIDILLGELADGSDAINKSAK